MSCEALLEDLAVDAVIENAPGATHQIRCFPFGIARNALTDPLP
jgi:hypothetical protein